MASNQIKQIILDSRDRQSPTTFGPDYCIFQLPFPLNDVKSISLISANIPMTMFNVSATNNIIYLNDGINRVITFPIGNYNIYDLVTQLQTSLNAVSSLVFTVTYSLVSMRLTFSATGSFYFTFSNITKTMCHILGFITAVDTTPATIQISPYAPNLSIPMYINMSINEFGSTTKSTNPNDNSTFTIFTDCNNSDIMLWTENEYYEQRICVLSDNIQQILVRLTSHNNKTIDLNGANWCAMLNLHYC